MNAARGQSNPARNLSPDAFKYSLPCKVSAATDATVRRLAKKWGCTTSHVTRWGIKLALAAAAKGEKPEPPENG
jgi:hypothetical protein